MLWAVHARLDGVAKYSKRNSSRSLIHASGVEIATSVALSDQRPKQPPAASRASPPPQRHRHATRRSR